MAVLNIQVSGQPFWSNNTLGGYVLASAPSILGGFGEKQVFTIGATQNPSANPPVFVTTQDAVNYYTATLCTQVMTDANNQGGSYTSYTSEMVPTSVGTMIAALQCAMPNITPGASSQYVKGDLSLGTTPTALSAFTNDTSFITASGAPVQSVAGRTGTVTLTKSDVGLANVVNLDTSNASNLSSGTLPAARLPTTTVTAGSYTNTSLTVDATGRISAVSTGIGAVARSFNNSISRTIQTVAAAGNGWQISATRDAQVSYSVGITVTASISAGQSGYIVLEVAVTNSSTATDWTEIGRIPSSQVYSVAVAIQGVQLSGGDICKIIPAGYYVRLRSANVTGTPTYTFNSGQEVLL